MYTVYSFAFLTYHRLLGRWQQKKEFGKKLLVFLGCLKCQPGRIYVLLADINVSVVFHEVNNEKVRPCPQNRRRERLQHLFRHGKVYSHQFQTKRSYFTLDYWYNLVTFSPSFQNKTCIQYTKKKMYEKCEGF